MASPVTLEQWRVFHAIVRHGGYAQAGRELNKSHSALHHAVAKMQDLLNVQLLQVEGKNVRLTEEGEVLYRRSTRLLENAEELQRTAVSLSQGWETELSLAVESLFPTSCLFNTLKAFYPLSRGCRLRIRDTVIGATTAAIEKQEVDLAITSFVPKGHMGTSVTEVELLIVVHRSHELARTRGEISLRDLEGHLQIVISERMEIHSGDKGWLKAEQRWTVDNMGAALACLYQGMGFCHLPRHQIEKDLASGELVALKIENVSQRKLWLTLVVPQQENLGPAGQLLRDLILKNSGCDVENGATVEETGDNAGRFGG
ncbi:LysR family transcriptional regulator [Kiloniella laminariae]|uniref:LysR family transcriptional regulator n=1 Tax=Kiloniella laminariae TaxID=454162 RepID=A0ABT4LIG2_9PROT|nr:LysR family transcriptional regulator [Kiloniella laminariae]MCZ4280900.1 LysR family transcriptional regulator [Kiloniella laminariae]